jgi:hypothetical protein
MTATRILLVTEDPYFIQETTAVLEWSGAKVISCLGPAHTDCYLYDKGSCPLARSVDIALVDSPQDGEFRYHATEIAAGAYAESLQRGHPQTHVVLCGAPEGFSGPTGEVGLVADHRQALFVLTRLLRSRRQEKQLESQGR